MCPCGEGGDRVGAIVGTSPLRNRDSVHITGNTFFYIPESAEKCEGPLVFPERARIRRQA